MSIIDSKQTAVQYLKKMVFPYLSHDQKMLVGQFFYEAEMMEKEQIIEAYKYGNQSDVYFKPEQYYNETFGGNNE